MKLILNFAQYTLLAAEEKLLPKSGGNQQVGNQSRKSIIDEASKHRLPAVYGQSIYADSGGLISYGPDLADMVRRASAYADKTFKGAKPGDLPIEQPTKFELVINLKTAKALGLKISHTVQLLTTRVIE